MVNLTTLRERCVDDVCVLNESDYAELDRPTTVAYSRYHKGAATGLANAIQRRFFDCSVPQIPKETVLRILEGARASDQIPRAVKRLLASLPP